MQIQLTLTGTTAPEVKYLSSLLDMISSADLGGATAEVVSMDVDVAPVKEKKTRKAKKAPEPQPEEDEDDDEDELDHDDDEDDEEDEEDEEVEPEPVKKKKAKEEPKAKKEKAIKQQDVIDVFTEYASTSAKQRSRAMKLLEKYGVKSVRDIPADKYADAIARIKKLDDK